MTIHVAVLGYARTTQEVKNSNANVRLTRLEMDTTATVRSCQGLSKRKGIDYLCLRLVKIGGTKWMKVDDHVSLSKIFLSTLI